jgi:hypothetical protein
MKYKVYQFKQFKNNEWEVVDLYCTCLKRLTAIQGETLGNSRVIVKLHSGCQEGILKWQSKRTRTFPLNLHTGTGDLLWRAE